MPRPSSILISFAVIFLAGFLLSGCSLKEILDLKAKAGLQVVMEETKPASLFLNDEFLDQTPYIFKDLKPGVYKLKIVPKDKTLAEYETQLTLTAGTLAVITWNPGKTPETSGGVIFELLPSETNEKSKAEINFVTIPDNVILSFDNQPQTFSPLNLTNVEPGNHELEVKLPSYQTQKLTLNAIADKKLRVTIKLAKQTDSTVQPVPSPTASQSGQLVNPVSLASSSTITPASLSAKINSAAKTGNQVLIKTTGFVQNNVEVLRVRAASNSTAATVGWAEVGKTYPHLGQSDANWLNLELEPQRTGWVSASYAELVNSPQ